MPPDDPNPNPNPNPDPNPKPDPSPAPKTPDQHPWGEKWREAIAGTDEGRLAQLKRFSDPQKWAESHFGLVQRIKTGELKASTPRPSGDAATPEALKAWRSANGLPAEPTEIKVPLPPGAKPEDLDDAAKARIEHFTKAFYDADVPQSAVDLIMTRYNEYALQEAQKRTNEDAKLVDETEDHLRAEWGGDYKSNIAIVDRFLQKAFGEDGADLIMGARTMDGRRLFNIPEVFKAFNQLGRANGVDDVVVGETVIGGKTVNARIEEIKQIMSTDMARYRAEGLDKEYAALLEKLNR